MRKQRTFTELVLAIDDAVGGSPLAQEANQGRLASVPVNVPAPWARVLSVGHSWPWRQDVELFACGEGCYLVSNDPRSPNPNACRTHGRKWRMADG